MPRHLIRAIKLVVSVALIAYLAYAVDWSRAANELDGARLSLLIAVAVIFAVNTVGTSAWKWQISLQIHGLSWRSMALGKMLLIGLFLSNFLPSTIGGDIYRVYRTMPHGGQKSRALSALLLDRVIGLLALLFVGALGALVLYVRSRDPAIGLLALVLAAPPLFAATVPCMFRLAIFKPLFRRLGTIKKLEPLMMNARLILADTRGLARLVIASVLFHVLAVAAIALLFEAVGTHVVLAESAVADAVSVTVALIPVSINGLGIQEGSFAFTAQHLGIDFHHAVIVALILRVLSVIASLCGGIVFFFDRGRAADLPIAAETVERSTD